MNRNQQIEKNEKILNDYYDHLTDIFVQMFNERERINSELSIMPWEDAPKLGGISNPFNGLSEKRYKGTNNSGLVMQTLLSKYSDPRWLTFNQIKEAGGVVRKGEHGTPIIFVETSREVPEVDEKGNKIYDANGKLITKKIPISPAVVKKYTVFNVEQCINFPPESKYAKPWNPKDMPQLEFDPAIQAEHWIDAIKAETNLKILGNGSRAAYFANSNMIEIPAPNYFSNLTEYYHVLFHEITHWTTEHGARKIQDLGFTKTEKRAYEELVADLGSFLICRELNLVDDVALKRIMQYISSFAEGSLSANTPEKFRAVLNQTIREAAKSYEYIHQTVLRHDEKHKKEADRIYLNVDFENKNAVKDVVEKLAILDTKTQTFFITSSHNPTIFKGYIDNFDEVLKNFTLRQQTENLNEEISDTVLQNVNNTSEEIQASQEKESNAPSPSVQNSNSSSNLSSSESVIDIYNPENFIKFVAFVSVKKFQDEVYKKLEDENIRRTQNGLSKLEITPFSSEETKQLHSGLANLLLNQYQIGLENDDYDPSYWKKNIMSSASALHDEGWSHILDGYIQKNYPKAEHFSNEYIYPEFTSDLAIPAINSITETIYETLDVQTGFFFSKNLISDYLSDSSYINDYADLFDLNIELSVDKDVQQETQSKISETAPGNQPIQQSAPGNQPIQQSAPGNQPIQQSAESTEISQKNEESAQSVSQSQNMADVIAAMQRQMQEAMQEALKQQQEAFQKTLQDALSKQQESMQQQLSEQNVRMQDIINQKDEIIKQQQEQIDNIVNQPEINSEEEKINMDFDSFLKRFDSQIKEVVNSLKKSEKYINAVNNSDKETAKLEMDSSVDKCMTELISGNNVSSEDANFHNSFYLSKELNQQLREYLFNNTYEAIRSQEKERNEKIQITDNEDLTEDISQEIQEPEHQETDSNIANDSENEDIKSELPETENISQEINPASENLEDSVSEEINTEESLAEDSIADNESNLIEEEEKIEKTFDKSNNFRIDVNKETETASYIRITRNIRAIQTLKVIEKEKRTATPEEQSVLALYSGWGGLASRIAISGQRAYTDTFVRQIKSILTDKEYQDAVESSLTAYYTSPKLISSIYNTLERMNFKGGNVLEPCCGTGQFIGAIPDTLKDKVNFVGVELDSISARITKQLYPHENIKECGFEKIKGKEKFDVVVGNVPFGDFSVYDPQYNKDNFKIHNYFMSKSLAMVKPGGVIALITTHHTLDSQSSDHRLYMAQRGEFLGAVRLPDTTFAPATNVVTDVIFLKKRERILTKEEAEKEEWINSKPINIGDSSFNVNNFFVNHPEFVAGDFDTKYTRFGLEMTVRGSGNSSSIEDALKGIRGVIDIKSNSIQEITEADLIEDSSITDSIRKRKDEHTKAQAEDAANGKKSKISRDPMVYLIADEDVQHENISLPKPVSSDTDVPAMSFVLLNDGSLRYHTKGSCYYKFDNNAPEDMIDTLKAVVKVRDSAHKFLNMQSEGFSTEEILKQQQNLNDEYGKFRRMFGTIGEYRKLFKDEASAQFLEQLEIREPIENGKYTAAERRAGGRFVGLADIFTKLTVRPPIQIDKVESADDALRVSLAKYGKVDMPYIAKLLGKDETKTQEIVEDLKGQIFLDMEQTVDNEQPVYVTRSEYLSGHIQHKIDIAEKYGLSEQVDELNKVLPQWVEAKDISIQLASNWLPVKFFNEFIDNEILDDNRIVQGKVKVSYTHETGNFNITNFDKCGDIQRPGTKAVTEYGTSRIHAIDLIECAFNHHNPIIYDEDNDTKVVNPKETAAAIDKLDKIQKRFSDWLIASPERCAEVEKIYNERFNSIRAREYDGSYLTLPGSNPNIQLKPHQLNAVARITEGGNSLLAHEVGAGKTFEMIAGAMESKRLGKCSKSLLCVPNHIVKQFEEDFRKLYPNANIIVARKEDFSKDNRKAFLAKIAVSNCDAVIMGHSQFAKLPLSNKSLNQFYSNEIALLNKALAAAKAEGKKRSVSELNSRIKKLKTRLEKLIKQDDKDKGITFEQTGIDKLFVDEAHSFKNLDTITSMSRVPGISSQGAGKSMDLLSKCQYLDSITGHKGVVFATGTPISNSMTEMFTMMRYLQSDRLEQVGLSNFDAWVSNFGQISSEMKLTPAGNKFSEKTSLASFKNVPELMNLFKEATDIKLAEDLKLNVPNAHFETIAVEPSDYQKHIIQSLAVRAEAVHKHTVTPDKDNMLKITHDGRALGLDQRAYDPSAPDVPGSKTNVCIAKVLEIYKETEANKSTQLIFCDQCVPHDPKKEKTDKIDEVTENDLKNEIDSSDNPFDENDVDTENKFDIYSDIKTKLIKAGVPEAQIAFIHDAKTEDDKQKLFHKVQAGEVRILLGSTAKMGAGTNVQNKLIALHHLDIGWKPSDIEQRNGRIIRQGNENKEVKVFNYVTKGTFDAYLWQMQEAKQKFIKQIMTSKSCVRNCADIDETELKYSEVKALAVGDGRIKEKMELEVQLKKLQLHEAAYKDEQRNLERLVKTILPEEIARLNADKERLSQDIETLKQHPNTEVFQGITLNGDFYGNRTAAEAEILKTIKNFNTRDIDSKPLGTYRGFNLSLEHKPASICDEEKFYIKISGKNSYATSELSVDGKMCRNIQRIDSRLSQVAHSLEKCQIDIESKELQLKNCTDSIGKDFPEREKMHEVEVKLKTLSAILAKTKDDEPNDIPEELSNSELSFDVDKKQENDNSLTESQHQNTNENSEIKLEEKKEHKHRIRR